MRVWSSTFSHKHPPHTTSPCFPCSKYFQCSFCYYCCFSNLGLPWTKIFLTLDHSLLHTPFFPSLVHPFEKELLFFWLLKRQDIWATNSILDIFSFIVIVYVCVVGTMFLRASQPLMLSFSFSLKPKNHTSNTVYIKCLIFKLKCNELTHEASVLFFTFLPRGSHKQLDK